MLYQQRPGLHVYPWGFITGKKKCFETSHMYSADQNISFEFTGF